jgi:predicted outer membrane repeat protein
MTFINCTFADNRNDLGINVKAGLLISDTLPYTDVRFTDCKFLRNRAETATISGSYSLNNGVDRDYRVFVEDCLFDGNIATNSGGAAMRLSGARFLDVRRTVFVNNNSTSRGGAVWLNGYPWYQTPSYFEDVLFKDNYSSERGGAITVEKPATFNNTRFEGNVAPGVGGAIYCEVYSSWNGTSISLVGNTTFANNKAGFGPRDVQYGGCLCSGDNSVSAQISGSRVGATCSGVISIVDGDGGSSNGPPTSRSPYLPLPPTADVQRWTPSVLLLSVLVVIVCSLL